MINVWYIALLLATVLPIVVGIGAFGAMYLKEEFYKHPFYEDDES